MDTLTFYFDRCFGRSLPEALRKAKPPFLIEYQHDPRGKHKFKQDTPDDKWLSVAGENGWIVFTHDRKFHRIEAECAAVKQFRIPASIYGGATRLPGTSFVVSYMRKKGLLR